MEIDFRFTALSILAGYALVASLERVHRLRLRESASIEPSARVIAIQTNVPQSNKIGWSPEDQAGDRLKTPPSLR